MDAAVRVRRVAEEEVAAVEVSPRTFFRYYAAKEDVVMGDRNRRTAAATAPIVKSTSSRVFGRPRPNRIEACARSSGTPIAFRT